MQRRQLWTVAAAGLCLLAIYRLQVLHLPSAEQDGGQPAGHSEVVASTASVCWKLDCLAELLLALPSNDVVPPIRHLLLPSNGSLTPEEAASLDSWRRLHPTWTLCLWTEDSVQSAVAKFFPKHRSLLKLAAGYEEMSRIFRFLVVQKYGGMFLSTRAELKVSAEPLRRLGAVFAARRPGVWRPMISGDFLMASAGHPAVEFCSERLLRWGSRADPGYAANQMLEQYSWQFPKVKRPQLVVHIVNVSTAVPAGQLATLAGQVCQRSATCTKAPEFQRQLEAVAGFGVGLLPRRRPAPGTSVRVAELMNRRQLRIVSAGGQHVIGD